MEHYELTYRHPSALWNHDGDDSWHDMESTQKIEAPEEQDALDQAMAFLSSHADWGDYPRWVKKLPNDIKLVNQPIKLTRMIKVW